MKLTEIRLYDVKVIKDNNTVYEGPVENAPLILLTLSLKMAK